MASSRNSVTSTATSRTAASPPGVSSAAEAAETAKWLAAKDAAKRTAAWARTMTKVAIAQSSGKGAKAQPQWEVVNFLGRRKSESRGIVDLLVIRKNHDEPGGVLKRGDLFDMVIIQVKGGSARGPSSDDLVRLRKVQEIYGARAVLLSTWKEGKKATFKELTSKGWAPLEDPAAVFSPARAKKLRAGC